MVSVAGIQHRNERTLGYLRVASDEHPLAIQIFGSEPGAMAEAARMVVAAGADIVDMNFGCPVPKVTRRGGGAAAGARRCPRSPGRGRSTCAGCGRWCGPRSSGACSCTPSGPGRPGGTWAGSGPW